MERTHKNIDQLLRERLYDAAPPPPAFVWDNVEQALQKRKRRKLIYWLFFSVLASAGIVGAWLVDAGRLQRFATGIGTEQAIAQNQAESSQSSAAISLKASNNIGSPTNNPVPENAEQLDSADGSLQPSSVKTPASLPFSQAAFMAKKGATNLTPPPLTPNETTPATPEAKPQKTDFEGVRPIAGFSRLPQHQELSAVQFNAGAMPTNTLGQTLLGALKTKAISKKAVKNCYDFGKQPSAWIIDAYVGPSLAQREMTARPDDKPYLNKRLGTETRDLAFNAGARATLMLKGNFLLQTGIQYEQMTEVFEFIDPDYVRYHVEITTQNGVTTIDTVGVDYGEKYQKTYNRFGMLDIPFAAGIELRKGRSGFNINAGVSFNMLFWKRGAIIAPNTGEPAWFTPQSGTLDVFRTRTGLSASASVQWFHHVSPRLRVFVEPYYKKILRPVTLNEHPVEQRYGLGGIRFGMSKILN